MSGGELEELGFEGGEYDGDAAFDIYAETVLFEGADENALPSMKNDIKTRSAAYAYMVFNLLCMPCFAAVGAMKRELKTWKATAGAVGIQMLTAYIAALLVRLSGIVFGW
jgi:ferrous iron transport protein B